MIFSDFAASAGLRLLSGQAPEQFSGVYVGDLLSRAMSHVAAGNLWITIMNNVNVVAVASLTEAAAIILAEGVALMPEALEAAREKGITVYSSDETAYDLCRRLASEGR